MVFEYTGQPEAGKDLILNYLVLSEFISRVSRGISNPGMDLWMNIDEGQRLFSQKKELGGHSGNSITDLAGLVSHSIGVMALNEDNLNDLPARPDVIGRIEVTFSLDSSGLLSAKARDNASGALVRSYTGLVDRGWTRFGLRSLSKRGKHDDQPHVNYDELTRTRRGMRLRLTNQHVRKAVAQLYPKGSTMGVGEELMVRDLYLHFVRER